MTCELFCFWFLGFGIDANRLIIRFYIKISNSSFSEKHPNLKIEVKILLKCPFLPIATKLESTGTIFFFNIQLLRHCNIAIGYAKFWFRPFKVWPRCFLVKITQIGHKVIIFFLEREEKIGPWLCHMWIFLWLNFFLMKMLFFSVLAISMGKRGIKVQPEVQTMGMFSVAKMGPTGMLVCFHTSRYALHVYFLFSYDHKTSSPRLPLLFFIDWFELFHRLIMNNVDYLGSSGSIELVSVHLVLF